MRDVTRASSSAQHAPQAQFDPPAFLGQSIAPPTSRVPLLSLPDTMDTPQMVQQSSSGTLPLQTMPPASPFSEMNDYGMLAETPTTPLFAPPMSLSVHFLINRPFDNDSFLNSHLPFSPDFSENSDLFFNDNSSLNNNSSCDNSPYLTRKLSIEELRNIVSAWTAHTVGLMTNP